MYITWYTYNRNDYIKNKNKQDITQQFFSLYSQSNIKVTIHKYLQKRKENKTYPVEVKKYQHIKKKKKKKKNEKRKNKYKYRQGLKQMQLDKKIINQIIQ